MSTPAVPCSRSSYEHLLADRAEGRVGGTTVVFNRAYRALYFSKEVIPHVPAGEVARETLRSIFTSVSMRTGSPLSNGIAVRGRPGWNNSKGWNNCASSISTCQSRSSRWSR